MEIVYIHSRTCKFVCLYTGVAAHKSLPRPKASQWPEEAPDRPGINDTKSATTKSSKLVASKPPQKWSGEFQTNPRQGRNGLGEPQSQPSTLHSQFPLVTPRPMPHYQAGLGQVKRRNFRSKRKSNVQSKLRSTIAIQN